MLFDQGGDDVLYGSAGSDKFNVIPWMTADTIHDSSVEGSVLVTYTTIPIIADNIALLY